MAHLSILSCTEAVAVVAQPAPKLMERARNQHQGVETLCKHTQQQWEFALRPGRQPLPRQPRHDLLLGCAPWESSESSPTSLMATGDGLEWAEWEMSLPPQGHICILHFTY